MSQDQFQAQVMDELAQREIQVTRDFENGKLDREYYEYLMSKTDDFRLCTEEGLMEAAESCYMADEFISYMVRK